ncbi:LPS export ABC transporter permease LptG [Variovorax sp. PCZ-1]|uniref:LPS export ABC transporter permease LptG n=1 Tax=Variovorax sp. PCZ-1 TaxID=2835533 RepID=UPI001BCDD491|nr:LPS export ABC transporter permease LptG [Variovorax sp. PCZ-1]MBS7807635.1 LPS export ABC transporter permease LptG [Variovorax sp. PCZ-1]
MQTIRRLLHREIWISVGFVALAFLTLFSFFDLVEELGDIGKGNPSSPYGLIHAALYTFLWAPSRLYELLPIAVLIGCIFVMARFAQSSEFTILRTSGMGPWRALKTLLWMGVAFTLLTFALGDYIAPQATRAAQLLKSKFMGQISLGQTGAWLKDRQQFSSYAVNVGALDGDGSMRNVKVYEFNSKGQILATVQAQRGTFEDEAWLLKDVQRQEFFIPDTTAFVTPSLSINKPKALEEAARVERSKLLPEWRWPTGISAEMVSVALLKPERMGTLDLFQYIRHLQTNNQTSQRYEIEFWRKVFYPLSCLVMVVLALPFAYLHFRSGAISGYVFAGVMIGISFFLLNNVFGYIGNLNDWTPWITAAAPGLIYSLASLSAFTWLVLRQ